MFQQPRNLHPMESMDFLMHQKMSERMLSSHQQMQPPLNLESSGTSSNKRSRVDQGVNSGYEHPPMVNFYPVADPATSSVVLTRTEYEAMRQEIVVLKRTLADFRGTVDTEIETLKKENKLLKRQISRCTCSCRLHATNQSHAGVSANDKLPENNGDIAGGSFDKRLDESDDIDLSNGTSHGLVDLLERDNKTLQQRNRDLEKQLHMLRATSSRVPPLPTSEAMSFMRELVAYYSLLESSPGSSSSGGAAASSPSVADATDLKDSYVSLLSLDSHQDRLSSVSGAVGYAMGFDAHSGSSLFANGLSTTCQLYGSLPEVFDAEKGLQVQLIPNYNVWVSKSKVQFIIKEAASQKDGAPLFVLRRLIPLVFSWEELAASRGQGLNCKSTDDVINKEPLDPTKVLVCKAFMRKFCMENGHIEPIEKLVNETFSHQVNYARRKFKARTPKPSDGGSSSGVSGVSHHGDSADQNDHNDSYSQSQCIDGSGQ